MLDVTVSSILQLLTISGLVAFLLMVPIALISGAMPGGGLPVTVVVLSIAIHLEPMVAIILMLTFIAASDVAEPVPSILLGVPGSRSAQATVLDGYPMARQGLAGVALGASYMTTLFGGIIGAAVLLMILPVAREVLRLFGSAEFFLFGLLGVAAVAVVSSGALVKGILTALFGFGIALIGFSPTGGVVRANFGIDYLWDGVPLIPIVVGLFAIPEVIDLVTGNSSVARQRVDEMLRNAGKDVNVGMKVALKHKYLMVRSSILGTVVSMMPGLGASAAHWMAYAHARQTEPGAKETFGTGDVRGIIAADSVNNSSDGGNLVPTLVFGIPGSGGMAIFLGLLVVLGFMPGPAMLREDMDIVLSMVWIIVAANVISVPVMLLFAPQVVKVTAMSPNILAPIVIGFVTLAAFQATNALGDLITMMGFAVLGLFMKRYGWPRPPILIAVVLAGVVERYMWLSINTLGSDMFLRPQFITIIALVTGVSIWAMRAQSATTNTVSATDTEPVLRSGHDWMANGEINQHRTSVERLSATLGTDRKPSHQSSRTPESEPERNWMSRFNMELAGEFVLLGLAGAFFGYLLIEAKDWPLGAALMPRIIAVAGLVFWALRIILLLRKRPQSDARIMDTGFTSVGDGRDAMKRFIIIFGSIITLITGIWLVGWHVALPAYVFLYLLIFGRIRWWKALLCAAAFLALLLGVYGELFNTPWNEPALFQLFNR
jgi:putative tricarboxylic transport membrane protein